MSLPSPFVEKGLNQKAMTAFHVHQCLPLDNKASWYSAAMTSQDKRGWPDHAQVVKLYICHLLYTNWSSLLICFLKMLQLFYWSLNISLCFLHTLLNRLKRQLVEDIIVIVITAIGTVVQSGNIFIFWQWCELKKHTRNPIAVPYSYIRNMTACCCIRTTVQYLCICCQCHKIYVFIEYFYPLFCL